MDVPIDRLVFIDESGCNLAMAPTHGWAPKGCPVNDHKPANWGANISIIGAIRRDRVLCHRTFSGAVNGPRFLEFVEQTLGPKLRAGDVVVLDNLRAHHIAPVREAIEARGAELAFLPPYSPDFNPIELLWSLLKRALRRLRCRTVPNLLTAIERLLSTVPRAFLRNWFANCGFGQRK